MVVGLYIMLAEADNSQEKATYHNHVLEGLDYARSLNADPRKGCHHRVGLRVVGQGEGCGKQDSDDLLTDQEVEDTMPHYVDRAEVGIVVSHVDW